MTLIKRALGQTCRGLPSPAASAVAAVLLSLPSCRSPQAQCELQKAREGSYGMLQLTWTRMQNVLPACTAALPHQAHRPDIAVKHAGEHAFDNGRSPCGSSVSAHAPAATPPGCTARNGFSRRVRCRFRLTLLGALAAQVAAPPPPPAPLTAAVHHCCSPLLQPHLRSSSTHLPTIATSPMCLLHLQGGGPSDHPADPAQAAGHGACGAQDAGGSPSSVGGGARARCVRTGSTGRKKLFHCTVRDTRHHRWAQDGNSATQNGRLTACPRLQAISSALPIRALPSIPSTCPR